MLAMVIIVFREALEAGLVVGIAGAAIYFGLLRIPLRYLLSVTSWLILLLAAGMASQAAAFLAAADVVPTLGNEQWNTWAMLTENSLVGQLAHVLIGYVARPAGIQIVFYVATLGVIGSLMRLVPSQQLVRSAR